MLTIVLIAVVVLAALALGVGVCLWVAGAGDWFTWLVGGEVLRTIGEAAGALILAILNNRE